MAIFGGVGGAQSFASASGGKVYGYNNINETTPRVVANGNPFRVSITFHNPGTNDIYIGPTNVQNVLGTATTSPSNVPLVPTTSLLGGMWRVFGNGGVLVISGECQGGWQALAVAGGGTTNSLTVMESNV